MCKLRVQWHKLLPKPRDFPTSGKGLMAHLSRGLDLGKEYGASS